MALLADWRRVRIDHGVVLPDCLPHLPKQTPAQAQGAVQSCEQRFSHPVVSCMPDNVTALAPRRSENKTRSALFDIEM
jgi:hypothetical protein